MFCIGLLMAETSNIAQMAEKISDDLFKWFKWDRLIPRDLNFKCHKGEKHASSTREKKTHPVDVLFKYKDPYSGKDVLFNTDLKSFKRGSISAGNIKDALYSLARTIECADGSADWRTKYSMNSANYEIRGLLFVYNHDGLYENSFTELFKPTINRTGKLTGGIKIGNIPLRPDQQLHIIEPLRIQYMRTIISDMNKLHHEGTFPENDYTFYYPDLLQHKLRGDNKKHPATIEVLTGPFVIIKHGDIKKYNESEDQLETRYKEGFVIYYNQKGEEPMEFVYLFDMLSNFQLLRGECNFRIRVACKDPFEDIMSSYYTAIEMYLLSWGNDEFKKKILDGIEFEIIEQTKDVFSTNAIGWT
jgi:hypothetical protein